MPDPTPDELFSAPASGPAGGRGYGGPTDPTPDQLFGPTQPSPPVQTGAAVDAWWSDAGNSLGRIVKQVGYGLDEPWDGRNVGLDQDTQAKLRKSGFFADYQSGNVNFLNQTVQAVVRPAADAADILWNTPAALAGGYVAGARQASAELGGQPPEGAILPTGEERTQALARGAAIRALTGGAVSPEGLEATAELASGVTKGYYPELAEEAGVGGAVTSAAARESRLSDVTTARAVGAVGEGEAGFYDAHPLTPETATARTEAAAEAGIEPPEPLPPPPDVHSLARRIDPETFQQYDALNAEAALHRDTIATLGQERIDSPEAIEAQGQIDTILGRVNNVPARLTNVARERLEAAQTRLDDILNTETPEMAEARSKLMDADFAMRDLAPDVSVAYRYAREIAPDIPETAPLEQPEGAPKAEEEGAPEPAAEMAAVSEQEQRTATVAGAATEPQAAQFRTPNVLGEPEQGAALARQQAREVEGVAPQPERQPTEGAQGGTPETVRVEPVEGTGETVTRGLAKHVEEDAIARGLTNSFGDLPEYERVSMADQARQASELIDRDYEGAKDIAMGRKSPPSGLLPESVYVGVERKATAEGDVETLRQLATESKLTSAATTMGQRIRTLGERDRASPVGAIQAVQQAREAVYGARLAEAKAATVAEIKAETKRAASKPDAFRVFLDSLLCPPE